MPWEEQDWPVGQAEIAERLGRSRKLVNLWRVRGNLPKPEATVSGAPCWRWGTIAAWKPPGRQKSVSRD